MAVPSIAQILLILGIFFIFVFYIYNVRKASVDALKELQSGETAMKEPPIPQIHLTEEEWRARLTPEQYHVMREKGTERAFTGEYDNFDQQGIYECAACALSIFSSATKFHSGTGWPSFYAPIQPNSVLYREDNSLFTVRVEVLCAKCTSHLGHVFDDGPPPTGKRYCLNSISLKFVPEEEIK